MMQRQGDGYGNGNGKNWARLLRRFAVLGVAMLCVAAMAWAQSLTTGAIGGVVTDPSGATIPGAKITVTSLANGTVHSVSSQANGSFLVPLLEPGNYSVLIEKTGFESVRRPSLLVAVTANISLPVKLQVGSSSQTVEVTGEAPLIEPENPNTSHTLTTTAIENLPDAGNDITFLAQTTPGALISKGGGTAGLTVNGLSGATLLYTMDGVDDNDPANNDSNSGPSNLLLGENSIAEVTVNTNAYAVDQGRMAAGNINYLTQGGQNKFHGDAQYQWNGRVLNAYPFFSNANPVAAGQTEPKKSFDNVNNWAGNIGGPIFKNKLFFFFDNEGARIVLPEVVTASVPTPAFEAYAAQQMAIGGYDTNTSAAVEINGSPRQLPAEASCAAGTPGACTSFGKNAAGVNEEAWLSNMFNFYGNTAVGTQGQRQIVNTGATTTGCNILANGTIDPGYNPQLANTGSSGSNPIPSDPGCVNSLTYNTSNVNPETFTNFRMDFNANANNTFWWKFSDDQGTQATSTSAINPLFNQDSFQPDRQGTFDFTHTFSPTLTNDFTPGFLWYAALFHFNDPAAVQAAIPVSTSLSGFTSLGGNIAASGRDVLQYQFVDNIRWTKGAHQLLFGENWVKIDYTDHSPTSTTTPTESNSSLQETEYGVASSASERFPVSEVEPARYWSWDLYTQDTWKVMPKLTVTYGIRATHNSNMKNPQGLYAQPFDWDIANHGLSTPLSADITTSNKFWASVPFAIWQPRLSIAYQPRTNTLFKAGWGMFSAINSLGSTSTFEENPPLDPLFTGGIGSSNLGQYNTNGCTSTTIAQPGSGQPALCGALMDFNQPQYSAISVAPLAESSFKSLYSNGGLSCAAVAAGTPCIPITSATAQAATGLKAPLTYEWNTGIEQQLGKNFAVDINYVGNRSTQVSYTVDPNGYEQACPGCFSPFPNTAADPRFTSFTQTRYGGWSSYNGLQTTFKQRVTHGLTYDVNYTYSHCLSTATPFEEGGNLGPTYRDCSIDITHVVNSDYTYQLPGHFGGALGTLLSGWQVSGATFFESGSPIFIGNASNGDLVNTSAGAVGAVQLSGVNPYAVGSWLTIPYTNLKTNQPTVAAQTVADTVQWLNPNAFASTWDSSTSSCYNPTTNTEIKPVNSGTPSAAMLSTCQFNTFGANYANALRGPWFNWTNMDLTKNIQLTEKIKLRLDGQFYNLFNHANFNAPSGPTGAVFINSSTTGAPNSSLTKGSGSDGAITSAAEPTTSLLGSSVGAAASPRMIALQAKINF